MSLKATELMQGDLVLYEYNGEKIHARVVEIYRSSALVESVSKEYEPIEIAEDKLFPVDITPEILEKNGFRVDGSGTNSRCLLSPLDEQGIRFNMYVGLKYKTIDVFAAHPEERTRGWRKSNKVYLEICGPYVHELQHALRLCGIEKEIEL